LKNLASKDLEKRIIQFLKRQNMCVLAACGDSIPQATPIEYHSKRTTIYFVGEPGAKMENMKKNPDFSIGIFLPYTG
jgi:nitroimidazol reductase NimA-like FMN-containing flavoprotein (pyridoxamine 5'-phosphate oxidase superfamily)